MLSDKYEPLYDHLRKLSKKEWRPTFSEIEQILGRSLPKSARAYPAWWSNGRHHAQSSAWLNAGWKTSELNLTGETIRFARFAGNQLANQASHLEPHGEKGSEKEPIAEGGQLSSSKLSEIAEHCGLRWAWVPIGYVTKAASGHLKFPAVQTCPGLYRFELEKEERHSVYIGETDNLQRRLYHYRNPGPSQKTNIRLNEILQRALEEGREISLAVMVDAASIVLGGVERPANFSVKAERVLVEHAAIVRAKSEGFKLLNR